LFETDNHHGVALLLPSGKLDAGTVGGYQRRINELPRTDVHYFVISVDGVSFVGIAGLGALARMYEWVRIGDVRLARMPSSVVKTLKIPHLGWVFRAYPIFEETSISLGR
jgi:anti-anti-sigma factor